jgi:uncharacterized membrane protein
MPTLIGVFFFCCALYCFLWKQEALLGLLFIASIFQAASAINFDERGIQPYYVVALFLIARATVNWGFDTGSGKLRIIPARRWLVLFAVIGVGSAFTLPFLFAGTPVYDPKIGIDDGFRIHPPLSFGLNNLAQAGFLFAQTATALSIVFINFSSEKAHKAYIWAFYLVVGIIAAQSICQFAGIPFPNSVFLNNPGYSLWDEEGKTGGTRNPGTFAEPSLVGGFLIMYFGGFLFEYLAGKKNATNLIVAFLALGLVASGGSFVAMALVTAALLVRYFPFRFPWYIAMRGLKRFCVVLVLFSAPVVYALLSPSSLAEALLTNTAAKTESGSFLNRTAADLYSLQLIVQTHGLGVGLGSNRASSLLTTLGSNVGVLGLLVFFVFCIKLFFGLPKEYRWLLWGAGALLLNMSIGIADVTIPMLWIPILLAIQFTTASRRSVNGGLSG